MLDTHHHKNHNLNERLQHITEPLQSPSRILQSQLKEKCINCNQNANIICYACCFQVGCQKCFDSDHFIHCDRQFNKYTINVSLGSGLEESRTKRNGKRSRVFQKCKRCESPSQEFENCIQCKTVLCKNCSQQIHSKGKFVKHQRRLSLSPQKKKQNQAVLIQNCEDNLNQRKENLQGFEYGLISNKQQKSMNKVSNINKMGRSINKVPFQNQQNTPNKKYRRSSMNESIEQNIKMSKCQPVKENFQKWQLCQNHNKLRNVLTQTYDIVCGDCYEQLKNSFSKLKIIDSSSWIRSQPQKEALFGLISVVFEQSQFKITEITNDFKKYRQELTNQLNKKCQMLHQRFRNNVLNLQKWQNQYRKQIQEIKKSCSNLIGLKQKLAPSSQSKTSISSVLNLHACLLYEKILREKRQLNNQMQQYQFKVAQINPFQFEQIIKNFAFTRRKIDGQSNVPNKILNKMSQSHQLRQSRVSSTSLTSDRKTDMKRQESSLKSNYYELSNGGNLIKRSMSKETKQDLTKDISQRVLFPITNARSDKKQKILRQSIKTVVPKNSNYFFQSVTDQGLTQPGKTLKKEAQVLNFGHKKAKYINLETIITQKLDKNGENIDKREILKLSTSNLVQDNLKKSIYVGQLTQQPPRNSELDHNKLSLNEQQSTLSIPLTQSMTIKPKQDPTTSHNIVQSNANLQSVKNKRKSDYMEMRDRLRKPNLITKIGK